MFYRPPIDEKLSITIARLRESYQANLHKETASPQERPLRVGIIGKSGSGKSSLINALAERYLSKVGVTETTNGPVVCEDAVNQIDFEDLPGCGTTKWPLSSYADRLKLREDYGALLFVNSGRISQDDIALYRSLKYAGVPMFVVRTHFDAAVNGERGKPEERRQTEQEMRERIDADFRRQFKEPSLRSYLVGNLGDAPFDLAELKQELIARRDELRAKEVDRRRRNLLMSLEKHIGEFTAAKLKEAKSRVDKYYLRAAGTVFIPPLLDVGALVALILAMNREIASVFSMDVDEDSFAMPKDLKVQVIELRLLGRESGVVALLERMAERFAWIAWTIVPFGGIGMISEVSKSVIGDHEKVYRALLRRGVLTGLVGETEIARFETPVVQAY